MEKKDLEYFSNRNVVSFDVKGKKKYATKTKYATCSYLNLIKTRIAKLFMFNTLYTILQHIPVQGHFRASMNKR